MTEALIPGPVQTLTATVAYSVPPGPHWILSSVALTYATTVGGSYSTLTGATTEPGALVEAGFVKAASTALVIAKKITRLNTYAAAVAQSNPLSYFRFNEAGGSINYDYMGLNPLTKGSGITLAQTGPMGDGSTCALFDGNGTNGRSITSSGVNTWSGGTAISFEAWVYNPAWSATHEVIISLGGVGIYMSVNNAALFMSIFLAAQHTVQQSGSTLSANTWTHVAGTWESGDYLRLYVNGAAVGLNGTTVRTGTIASSANIFVGVLGPTLLPYSGYISDVALYMRKLTASEIMAHYSARNVR